MAWPSLRRELAKSQLGSAGRQLRAELTRARFLALESGAIHEFHYWPGEARYEVRARPIVPIDLTLLDDRDSSAGALLRDNRRASTESSNPTERREPTDDAGVSDGTIVRGTLPEGIVFENLDASPDEGLHLEDGPNGDALASASTRTPPHGQPAENAAVADSWSLESLLDVSPLPPVLFLPTGRTSTVTLRLVNSSGSVVEVRLEGLTGVASVGRTPRDSRSREQHELSVDPAGDATAPLLNPEGTASAPSDR
jgi:hypothetical protein